MGRARFVVIAAVLAAAGVLGFRPAPTEAQLCAPFRGAPWVSHLLSLRWVAYSPTHSNPQRGIAPPSGSVQADLAVLRAAGFDGLVTYGRLDGLPGLAARAGFRKMLYGVWNPSDASEMDAAKRAGRDPLVLGFVVGNEGMDSRYTYEAVRQSIETLRQATGKPVTTTEEVGDYADPKVRQLGDWLFPNVHPWYQRIGDPSLAVEWVERRFRRLTEWVSKPVLLKEVGLPSAGDPAASEAKQAAFYRQLSRTQVKFVWFEAFDQPWKTQTPVEPFWGLFRADRTPKPVVWETRSGGN